MKTAEKMPRRRRGREPEPHGWKDSPAATELRTFVLEIEPAIHRLGDGIEALQVAGTAADAIAPAAIAWFAETLRVDIEALRRIVAVSSARIGLPRRGRRRS